MFHLASVLIFAATPSAHDTAGVLSLHPAPPTSSLSCGIASGGTYLQQVEGNGTRLSWPTVEGWLRIPAPPGTLELHLAPGMLQTSLQITLLPETHNLSLALQPSLGTGFDHQRGVSDIVTSVVRVTPGLTAILATAKGRAFVALRWLHLWQQTTITFGQGVAPSSFRENAQIVGFGAGLRFCGERGAISIEIAGYRAATHGEDGTIAYLIAPSIAWHPSEKFLGNGNPPKNP